MVSVIKDGHFQKHCTAAVGVVYHCSTLVKVKVDLCPVSDHRDPAAAKNIAHGSDYPVTSYIFYYLKSGLRCLKC